MGKAKQVPSAGLRNRGKKGATNTTKNTTQNVLDKDAKDTESGTSGNIFRKFCCYMFEPDDASYLAVFRIMWGLIMMKEMWDHIKYDFAKTTTSFYQNPEFTYKYYGLEWCEIPDLVTMKIFIVSMFILAIFITVGFMYRISSILYAFGFVYFFGLEAALYLNHFYLVAVMCVMLCFLPCHVYFSVDALIFPGVASATVPKWCLWVIRAELWVVYTYAGVAKMNLDWLRSEPLRHWLIKRRSYPIIGFLFEYEPVVYWFSWSGMIYDTIIGTLLVIPQTFYLGLFATLFFHLMNKYIFNIGIFPWLMIASTSLFFEPYWPRRLIHNLRESPKRYPAKFRDYAASTWSKTKVRKLKYREMLMLFICFCFLAQQVITPVRHYMYPGNVFWNEHGHRYSWRMKLRDKQCDGELYTYIPKTQEWFEFPLETILTPRQYQKFTSRPEFIAQAVEQANKKIFKSHNGTAEMYVYAACRVNYREAAMLTNPRIDLSNREVWDWPYDWMTEMPELSESQRAELPWNFEWNFNWLFKPWESNIPILKKEQEDNIAKMKILTSSWGPDFREWIIEEKFNGDVALADSRQRHYVNEKNKERSRQQALNGLLIFR